MLAAVPDMSSCCTVDRRTCSYIPKCSEQHDVSNSVCTKLEFCTEQTHSSLASPPAVLTVPAVSSCQRRSIRYPVGWRDRMTKHYACLSKIPVIEEWEREWEREWEWEPQYTKWYPEIWRRECQRDTDKPISWFWLKRRSKSLRPR